MHFNKLHRIDLLYAVKFGYMLIILLHLELALKL